VRLRIGLTFWRTHSLFLRYGTILAPYRALFGRREVEYCIRRANRVPLLSRFLLKYASRDSVVLLARGTGGVAEIRIAIDGYEEKSPLYGFLQYRRRKVVLKYVPDGTSRLLQGTFHGTADPLDVPQLSP
jgi:hypothetical protein